MDRRSERAKRRSTWFDGYVPLPPPSPLPMQPFVPGSHRHLPSMHVLSTGQPQSIVPPQPSASPVPQAARLAHVAGVQQVLLAGLQTVPSAHRQVTG